MKSLSGIIVGALAGVAVGILMAPESGEKTRKKLAEDSEKVKADLEDSLGKSVDNFLNTVSQAIDEYSKESKRTVKKAKKKKRSFF